MTDREKAIYVLEMNNPFLGGKEDHDLSEAMDIAIKAIKDKRCERAILIPDGATNRDIIREIWHDETLLSNIKYCYGEEWLNSPYNPPKQNLAPADKSGLEYADQPTLQSAT